MPNPSTLPLNMSVTSGRGSSPKIVSGTTDNPDPRVDILIVDDNPEKLVALEAVLTDLGENIITATSGAEALRYLLNRDVAVILLDVNMPLMDGFETASLIRERERTRHTPIIFVTAISDADASISHGYALGAVDYILSPIVPEILRTKVTVFIELYKRTSDAKRQAEELERRVRERTAELARLNKELHDEIAERKLAEEQILKLNEELERRVTERTAQLTETLKELEAFTYSVSHDLKAPLRHIDGFATVLASTLASKLDDESRKQLEIISRSAKQLGRLIEDLLNLSRISRTQLSITTIDMGALFKEVIQDLHAYDPTREITWRIESLPCINGDKDLLRSAVTNLLSNALKYTRKQPNTVVEIGTLPDHQKEHVFFVRDNGIGFDMSYISKLFGVFQRLHAAEDYEGTGVGLANVRRIIERHGGTTWAEGTPNAGATFYFSLPM